MDTPASTNDTSQTVPRPWPADTAEIYAELEAEDRRARRSETRLGTASVSADVIVHSSLGAEISPVVSVYWRGLPETLYRQGWEVAHWGSDPCDVCAKFIGWCYSQPQAMTFVHNLPGVPGERFETENELRVWYQQVISAAARWEPPALLADVDEGCVRQGELVRWCRSTSAAEPSLKSREGIE